MADERSFSAQVKEELAHIFPTEEDCQRMELAALLRACGRIEIAGQNRLACTLVTDHASVARKIFRLVKVGFALETEVMVMRRRSLRKNLRYIVRIPSQPGLVEMLVHVGIVDVEGRLTEWGELPSLESDLCRRAYLRGIFLGSGWIAAPDRQHHLEMTTTATEAADAVGQLLFGYGIPVRVSYRKESLVLYVKGAEQISRFLGLVGAHQALLHYEDVRVMKEMKNRINRQVNGETANLAKVVDASARQVELLQRLAAAGTLEQLSKPLRELAMLRLNHPDASLKELGEMCDPPVGKSGINHRMRLLLKLAEGATES